MAPEDLNLFPHVRHQVLYPLNHHLSFHVLCDRCSQFQLKTPFSTYLGKELDIFDIPPLFARSSQLITKGYLFATYPRLVSPHGNLPASIPPYCDEKHEPASLARSPSSPGDGSKPALQHWLPCPHLLLLSVLLIA